MAKLFKIFVNIILIIVIVLLLGYLVLRVTDKIEIYNVKTGSMEEKIHAGDYILIFRKSSYNVGDVVTYTSSDGFITHRIIKKEGSKITTKGDANNTEDNEIIESSIVGKVIISGGILNIVIEYKYIIVCLLLSLYLFSCYFGGNEKETLELDKEENEILIKEEINNDLDNESENIIEESKDINLIKNNDVEKDNNDLEEIEGLIKIDNNEDNDIKEIKKKTTKPKTRKKDSKKKEIKKETTKEDTEKSEDIKK